jgi:Tol biopolymer transport system component
VFSKDGNYLFYLSRKLETPLYRSLYRMASLGGPAEERAFDVDSRAAFSPDESEFAFVRGYPQNGYSAILTKPISGGDERELVKIHSPEVVTSDAVWSPDGRHIAVCIITPPPVSSTALAVFDAKSGDRKDLIVRKNGFYNGLAWKGDGSGLLMTGADLELGFTNQLVEVSYPQGQMGRITNDFNQYNEPSVTISGDIIAVLGTSTLSNIYSAGLDQTPAALTRATARENAPMQFAVSERHIFYNIIRDRNLRLFSMPLAGGDGRIFGLAKMGPGENTICRRPVCASSWMISVPVISDGIRSGVNWIRENFRFSTWANVCTNSVFARPGTPMIRELPPTKSDMSMCSMTSS